MGESRVPLATARDPLAKARRLSKEYSAVLSAFAGAKISHYILTQDC